MTTGRHRRPAHPPGEAPGPEAARAPGSPTWALRLTVLLFAGSGCAALVYEIVWFQLLELVVGSSAISLGILLADGSFAMVLVQKKELDRSEIGASLLLCIGVAATIATTSVSRLTPSAQVLARSARGRIAPTTAPR